MPGLGKTVGPMKPSVWARAVNSAGNSKRTNLSRISDKWSKSFSFSAGGGATSGGPGGSTKSQQHVVGGEWTQQELQEHIKWIQDYLGEDRLKTIQDLKMAINDGVTIVRLLQILSEEQIPGINQTPVTRSERQKNLQSCIEFLKKNGGTTHELTPHDLITGETRSVLILVRNMRFVFDKNYPHNLSSDGRAVSSDAKMGRSATIPPKDIPTGMPGALQASPSPSTKTPKKISETQLHPDGVSQLVISETRTSSLASNTLSTLPGELQADYLYPNNHSSSTFMPPPPPPPEDFSSVQMTTVGQTASELFSRTTSHSTGHGALEPARRSVTPVSIAEPHSDSTGATVVAYKRRPSSSPRFPDSSSRPSSGHQSARHLRQNSQSPLTESHVPYSRHSRPNTDSASAFLATASASVTASANGLTSATASAAASVSSRTYQPAVWDLGVKRNTPVPPASAAAVALAAASGTMSTEKGSVLSQPGTTLSIASCMSSDFYTDDTDDTGIRAALNYPMQLPQSPSDLMRRPEPAMGYYRDNLATPDTLEAECEIPPDLLPSPSIQAKLRVLLSGGVRAGDSDVSSEAEVYGSVTSIEDLALLKQQMAGLEGMYRELLRHVGADVGAVLPQRPSSAAQASSVHSGASAPSRRYLRHVGRRKQHDVKTIGRRVEKLETHVVTLAQSVAEISSDLEQMRMVQPSARGTSRDGSDTALRSIGSASTTVLALGPSEPAPDGPKPKVNTPSAPLDRLRQNLRHPRRLAKLKWFFGREPPFLKEFLETLGFEKYWSCFEKEDIGLQELPLMTDERLKALGLPLGPRIRLLEEINKAFATDPNVRV